MLNSKIATAFSLALKSLAAVFAAAILFILVVVFIQLRKDAQADEVARVLETRIASQRQPLGAGLEFPPYGGGLSYWANHKPQVAPVWDRLWNSRYPAVAGIVATKGELDQVKAIVDAVCAEMGYNPQLVAFVVQVEAREVEPN